MKKMMLLVVCMGSLGLAFVSSTMRADNPIQDFINRKHCK